MKVALFPNFRKKNALPTALKCCEILNKLEIEILVPDTCKNEFSEKDYVVCSEIDSIISESDIVIAIGGDGTILQASAYASEYDKLLLGINTGRLGFMASMESDELENLSRLKTHDYVVETRMMIDAALVRNNEIISQHTALNDIVISRPYAKITDYEVLTDGIVVSSMRSDGMVFATPTGSTAYALSAGGPILEADTECIQLTPICPHSLFSRTMVFNADRVLEVRHKDNSNVYYSVDGSENRSLLNGDKLIIKKSAKKQRLIDIKGHSFFEAVNKKLMTPIK